MCFFFSLPLFLKKIFFKLFWNSVSTEYKVSLSFTSNYTVSIHAAQFLNFTLGVFRSTIKIA